MDGVCSYIFNLQELYELCQPMMWRGSFSLLLANNIIIRYFLNMLLIELWMVGHVCI